MWINIFRQSSYIFLIWKEDLGHKNISVVNFTCKRLVATNVRCNIHEFWEDADF